MAQQVIAVGTVPNDATGDPLRTAFIKTNANFAELYLAKNPVGGLVPFAGASAPAGWLLCQGQLINRVTYAVLFAVIGTTYGVGDGTTTFGVPDLKGRSIFGFDPVQATGRLTAAVSGLNSGTLGAAGGHQSLTAHTHNVSDPTHQHTTSGQAVNVSGAVAGGDFTAATAAGGTTDFAGTGVSVLTSGAGNAQNVPPAIIMNYIIFAAA